MEFSRQEYWSGLPFPSPRDLPHPEMEPSSPISPALAGRSFTISASWECTDLIKAYMWKSGRQEPPRSQEQLNGWDVVKLNIVGQNHLHSTRVHLFDHLINWAHPSWAIMETSLYFYYSSTSLSIFFVASSFLFLHFSRGSHCPDIFSAFAPTYSVPADSLFSGLNSRGRI